MPRVFLSIGSTINRAHNIRSALRVLEEEFGELQASAIYESEAVGFEGDNFYNLVVGFDTGLELDALIERLHAIEFAHGRTPSDHKFAPRTLDLDVLLYGDRIDHEPPHDLPRREISEYAFVLLPLSEIAGQDTHPETGRSYAQMWREFDPAGQRLWRVKLEP